MLSDGDESFSGVLVGWRFGIILAWHKLNGYVMSHGK